MKPKRKTALKKKVRKMTPIRLTVYKIKGKFYYLDKRLGEYRNIKNPSDRIAFNSFPSLQKPTKKDSMMLK